MTTEMLRRALTTSGAALLIALLAISSFAQEASQQSETVNPCDWEVGQALSRAGRERPISQNGKAKAELFPAATARSKCESLSSSTRTTSTSPEVKPNNETSDRVRPSDLFSFPGASSATQNPTPTPEVDHSERTGHPVSNGSNPVDLITRVEMKYQFQNFAAGYLHAVPVIRGDYAFSHTVSFRIDLPILTFDRRTPGGGSESGIGDVVTSMTFVKPLSKKVIGAFVPRIDWPTASHATLGTGKYVFIPLLAVVTPLAPHLGFVGLGEYHVSFAGNKNRSDINELHIKPIILKSFAEGALKGYYANPKAEIIIDFEHDNNTTLQLSAEFGKPLNKNVVVFVIPTVHTAGTKRESFKLELGFRYLFR